MILLLLLVSARVSTHKNSETPVLLLPLFTSSNGTFLVCDFVGSARDSSSSNLCSPARDSSSSDLRSPERFSDLVLLLLLPISGSSSSSPSSFIYFSRTWVFKTRVPCDENFSMSAIRTRVFVTRFFHKTRASNARDGMFLIFSRFLLTNYIVGQTPVILQIASSL